MEEGEIELSQSVVLFRLEDDVVAIGYGVFL